MNITTIGLDIAKSVLHTLWERRRYAENAPGFGGSVSRHRAELRGRFCYFQRDA